MMTWHLGLTALGAAGNGSVGVMQMMCRGCREGGMES